MLGALTDTFRHLWFRDPHETPLYINDTAVRIRAGFLLFIPLFMGWTLFDSIYSSPWLATGEMVQDTLTTDFDGRIIYQIEAVRRTYDYTLQTWLLLYALFEMLAGMFVITSRLSPTIWLASFLARNKRPLWKPLLPKRFAWTIGATLVTTCLIFFNPEVFAGWVNAVAGIELLPTTENYMPSWIPTTLVWVCIGFTLVWVCIGFMWMETVLGFCAGCQVHALLVKLGIFEKECEACNNLEWDSSVRRS